MEVRRALWEKCCSVLTGGTEPSHVQVSWQALSTSKLSVFFSQELCATLLKLITTHSKKSRKKCFCAITIHATKSPILFFVGKKLALRAVEEWNDEDLWTR